MEDAFARRLMIEHAVSDTPLVTGNKTQLLQDGTETFRAMFSQMAGAKHSINLEYCMLENIGDDIRLGGHFVVKLGQGAAVNISCDGYGASDTPASKCY